MIVCAEQSQATTIRRDRLGRNLRHLVTMLEDLNHLGVAFVSLGEGIDCTTPAGKLQLQILAALAGFERERIRERVVAGLRRAKAQGKRLGRPRRQPESSEIPGGSVRSAARVWGVSKSTAARWINCGREIPALVEMADPKADLRLNCVD